MRFKFKLYDLVTNEVEIDSEDDQEIPADTLGTIQKCSVDPKLGNVYRVKFRIQNDNYFAVADEDELESAV